MISKQVSISSLEKQFKVIILCNCNVIGEQINIFSNNVLIFASDNEELVNKWLCVLDYFSSKI